MFSNNFLQNVKIQAHVKWTETVSTIRRSARCAEWARSSGERYARLGRQFSAPKRLGPHWSRAEPKLHRLGTIQRFDCNRSDQKAWQELQLLQNTTCLLLQFCKNGSAIWVERDRHQVTIVVQVGWGGKQLRFTHPDDFSKFQNDVLTFYLDVLSLKVRIAHWDQDDLESHAFQPHGTDRAFPYF